MVGHHFLEQCVSRNLHQQYQIVVFGEERYAAYDRVHLSEYFAGRSADSLSLVAGDFFAEHGIELRLSQRVTAIDTEARLIRDADGHELHWTNWCWRPAHTRSCRPFQATRWRAVLSIARWTISMRLPPRANRAPRRGYRRRPARLEAANALRQLGLETHVVEFAPNLMAVQLDNGGAAMLREKITELGVSVHTSKATTGITESENGLTLSFADGESLTTDMVVFSAGSARRIAWRAARACVSVSAAASSLITNAVAPARISTPSASVRCGTTKSMVWWRLATRWHESRRPRWRARRANLPARI